MSWFFSPKDAAQKRGSPRAELQGAPTFPPTVQHLHDHVHTHVETTLEAARSAHAAHKVLTVQNVDEAEQADWELLARLLREQDELVARLRTVTDHIMEQRERLFARRARAPLQVSGDVGSAAARPSSPSTASPALDPLRSTSNPANSSRCNVASAIAVRLVQTQYPLRNSAGLAAQLGKVLGRPVAMVEGEAPSVHPIVATLVLSWLDDARGLDPMKQATMLRSAGALDASGQCRYPGAFLVLGVPCCMWALPVARNLDQQHLLGMPVRRLPVSDGDSSFVESHPDSITWLVDVIQSATRE